MERGEGSRFRLTVRPWVGKDPSPIVGSETPREIEGRKLGGLIIFSVILDPFQLDDSEKTPLINRKVEGFLREGRN